MFAVSWWDHFFATVAAAVHGFGCAVLFLLMVVEAGACCYDQESGGHGNVCVCFCAGVCAGGGGSGGDGGGGRGRGRGHGRG